MAKRITATEFIEQQQKAESLNRAQRDRKIAAIVAANPLAAAVAEANGLDLIVLEKACRDARPAHPQAIPQKPKAKRRRRGDNPANRND